MPTLNLEDKIKAHNRLLQSFRRTVIVTRDAHSYTLLHIFKTNGYHIEEVHPKMYLITGRKRT